jgi:hypothetical protein
LGIGDGADGCLTRFRPDAQLPKDLHQAETVKLIIVTPPGTGQAVGGI